MAFNWLLRVASSKGFSSPDFNLSAWSLRAKAPRNTVHRYNGSLRARTDFMRLAVTVMSQKRPRRGAILGNSNCFTK
eukprot:3459818-Rhodomonas_salina.1